MRRILAATLARKRTFPFCTKVQCQIGTAELIFPLVPHRASRSSWRVHECADFPGGVEALIP